jgi:5-methyltetrahydropteroyltriglutamate--homocysteine methyltransferase
MLKSSSLGFPRIGSDRQLKKATEGYWKGSISWEQLQATASEIKNHNWQLQQSAGINFIASNDFSFYDHILDNIVLFGAIPERFKKIFGENHQGLDLYFAMARGLQKSSIDITALEMTKWFDTNYHYLVAEFSANQQFSLNAQKVCQDFLEAKQIGINTRPVIIGPVSFLLLGKSIDNSNKLNLLPKLLPVYADLFLKLQEIGVEDVQIDEPFLATDISKDAINAYLQAYAYLKKHCGSLKLHLTTYFESLLDNTQLAFDLQTHFVHIDLVRDENQLDACLQAIQDNQVLSLGLVDGRNIWINNLEQSIEITKKAIEVLGKNRVIIGSSCSLLHCPISLTNETDLDSEIKTWLAFAEEKLQEISIIAGAINNNLSEKQQQILQNNKIAIANRKISVKIHNQKVKQRVSEIDITFLNRKSNFATRSKLQQNHLNLPLLPTTTIGSFPQTKEVRENRANFKANKINQNQYNNFIKQQIANTIAWQEQIELDVLVHGEFERNDMVEYFGEQLNGFCFTKNGWVQSYGTRCVKPPIIFGDVFRDSAMTVEWAKYAQSLTKKIVKGMLTGPITILQWSFVRNDQPRSQTAKQIALAIRDEVLDLEKAGIQIIQIDEAALREGLPIRQTHQKQYLQWAVDAFRISASGVEDKTQIHTHMCYSEFNDIIKAIADMDADVISIETSRSQMELLNAFVNFKYPNEIGPGVYDIHSPRVPSIKEIEDLLYKALNVLQPEQIWVNPDCGLKTRDWPETKQALELMVSATKNIRATL